MSTAASLASAKKRRGPQYNDNLQTNNLQKQNNNINKKIGDDFKQEQLTNYQLLSRHEFRLYNLEKMYSNLKNTNENTDSEYITKKDLELFSLENNFSGINLNNTKLLNDLENSKGEISQLKNNIQNLTKTVNEMNSIIQTLRAKIITQDNETN